MRKGDMTREQAIERATLDAVRQVERENCELTSRVQTDGDTDVEWSASIDIDQDGIPGVLTVYYYTTPEAAQEEDLTNVNWKIHGYEIT